MSGFAASKEDDRLQRASPDAAERLARLLAAMPERIWIKMRGSYRYPVYPGWKKGRQLHDDMHLMFVRGGRGRYRTEDGAVLPLRRGSLILISVGCAYYAEHDESDPPLISGIRFELVRHGGRTGPARTDRPYYAYARIGEPARCDELTGALHAAFHGGEDGPAAKLAPLLVHQLLYELYFALTGSRIDRSAPDTECVREAKRFLDAHADRKVPVAAAAAHAGVSVRYLQKRFKAEIGLSPKAYHLSVQMDEAYKMLHEGRATVAETAARLGYSDAFAFSHQFKKHWGVAPASVRRRTE